jgi:prolyl-tRNA synthetase
MKTSNFLLATLRETPKEAETISHQLMLRAGMIRRLTSGIYTWLPLGLRVLKKVENLIREEMDQLGAMELLMPNIHPKKLWDQSGRWESTGEQLLKIKDRHGHDYCFGPTHEEVITDLVKGEVHSYKQLPLTFYQIQTKFRDEIRPRFGVMRGREFMMKDAYSFHTTEESLEEAYWAMYDAYQRIFTRLELKFRAVIADTGNIGGNISQEFQALSQIGEDLIAYSDASDYAANIEMAETLAPMEEIQPLLPMETVDTPDIKTIIEVANFFQTEQQNILRTIIVKGREQPYIALILRGDHELNEVKTTKLPEIASPLTLVDSDEFPHIFGCAAGFIGPVGLTIPIIVDRDAAIVKNFICGANRNDQHMINANWHRDIIPQQIADIRKVQDGDPSPDGKGILHLARGIEVGQIFQLGKKYSRAMGATVLDEQGQAIELYMGCYGIGVSRTVAAIVEQRHDDKGIVWPEIVAPFQTAIVPINLYKSAKVREIAERLYQELINEKFSVLFDVRQERAGVMFADMDLIGIPHRIVINERGLEQNTVEYKARSDDTTVDIALDSILDFLKDKTKTLEK